MSKKLKAASRERKAKTLPEALKKHCWPKGKSGNPGGGAKKFTTLLTDAIRDQLGEISPQDAKTYAAIIGGEMVKAAAKEVKEKGLTNQVLIFYRDVRDGTEGKPTQKVILGADAKKKDPKERVKEILAKVMERIGSDD
jgi:hypothetical protein